MIDMAAYEYVALDAKGRRKQGVQEADSARLVRQIPCEHNRRPPTIRNFVMLVAFATKRPGAQASHDLTADH